MTVERAGAERIPHRARDLRIDHYGKRVQGLGAAPAGPVPQRGPCGAAAWPPGYRG